MNLSLEIMLIAALAAVACALPGTFLVLRGVSLMSDAISHAILPGIVLMFLVVKSVSSPLLMVGAALAGVLTVICTEALIATHRLKKDAAIGLVFPLFFSVGVVLIAHYARAVHLDVDMVLLGELAFAPFNRLVIGGADYGPVGLWLMSAIGLLNILFILIFYKELQLNTFEYDYARVIGRKPAHLYYSFMFLVSLTTVAAFDAVGAIVVVALMIVPGMCARLMSDRLMVILIFAGLTGIAMGLGGYAIAFFWDVSIAGSIAAMGGILFFVSFLLHTRLPY